MNYFQHLNRMDYTFDATSPYQLQLTNITERARIAERLRQYTSVMYDYVVQDGQRPDTVAQLAYGDVKYTWLVLLLNNIFTLYDWPLSDEEFTDYIISTYGSVAAAHAGTPIYYTTDGVRVDATTYSLLTDGTAGAVLSPYDQELRDNEAKRTIKLVSSTFLPQIERTMSTLFR